MWMMVMELLSQGSEVSQKLLPVHLPVNSDSEVRSEDKADFAMYE